LCCSAGFVVSASSLVFALGFFQAVQCEKTCLNTIITDDKHLQKGLNIEDKAERVKKNMKTIRKEVEIIGYSFGVEEARLLRRGHCRVVMPNGKSKGLHEVLPENVT